MKIRSLLVVFAFLIGFQLYAQENSLEKRSEHQIGINATNFIQTLISFNGSTFNNTPYDFMYKYLKWTEGGKSAWGFRAGFGYTVSQSKIELTNTLNENKSETVNLRIGAEYQHYLNKHWNFYAGFDFKIMHQNTVSKGTSNNGQANTSEVVEKSLAPGFGPVAGIQFNISKRLSLGTELTVYTTSLKLERTVSNNGVPSPGSSFKRNIVSSAIEVPSFIYFIIKF